MGDSCREPLTHEIIHYDNGGTLITIDYSDSTSDITNTVDRLGRVTTITQGATVTTKSYSSAGQLVTESYAGGPLDGITITNSFDSYLPPPRPYLLRCSPTTTLPA